MRWVTFDCFGTLVDWNAGFAAILRPLVGDKTPQVMDAYHRFERLLEQETPHRLYKDVLTAGLSRAAQDVGVPLSEASDQLVALEDVWGRSGAVLRERLLEAPTPDAKLDVVSGSHEDTADKVTYKLTTKDSFAPADVDSIEWTLEIPGADDCTPDLTVSVVPVASVAVTPATASIPAGQTAQLSATPKDAGGAALTGRVVTWASSNTGVATVSGSGLVTGVAAASCRSPWPLVNNPENEYASKTKQASRRTPSQSSAGRSLAPRNGRRGSSR